MRRAWWWFVLAGGCCLASACASMGKAIGMSYDEAELKRSVAFETGCPNDKVKVLEAMEAGTGHSKFKLLVCGKNQQWIRLGTSYFPDGKAPGLAGTAAKSEPGETAPVTPTSEAAPPAAASPAAAPPVREVVSTAPVAGPRPSDTAPVGREEYEALVRRVAELELRAEGKKTNADLLADLQRKEDDAWLLRQEAARELGKRRVPEARPVLEAVVASPGTSGSLRETAKRALVQLGEARE